MVVPRNTASRGVVLPRARRGPRRAGRRPRSTRSRRRRPGPVGVLRSRSRAVCSGGRGPASTTFTPGGGVKLKIAAAGRSNWTVGEAGLEGGLLRAAREDLHAQRHRGLAVDRQPDRADQRSGVARRQAQLVDGAIGDVPGPVDVHLGAGVDGGQRLLRGGGRIGGHRGRGGRRLLLALLHRVVRRLTRAAGPQPHVVAVADDIGLGEVADQAHPGLPVGAVPDPRGVRTRDERLQRGSAAPATDGSSGSPSLAVSTTVPDSCRSGAFARSTSSCAAVLGGSFAAASAFPEVRATPAPIATTAPRAPPSAGRGIAGTVGCVCRRGAGSCRRCRRLPCSESAPSRLRTR